MAKIQKINLDEAIIDTESYGCRLFYEDDSIMAEVKYYEAGETFDAALTVNGQPAEMERAELNRVLEAMDDYCKERAEIEPDDALADNYWNNGVSRKDFY